MLCLCFKLLNDAEGNKKHFYFFSELFSIGLKSEKFFRKEMVQLHVCVCTMILREIELTQCKKKKKISIEIAKYQIPMLCSIMQFQYIIIQ